MAITVKHTKVSTIPDAGDDSLIEPSDWNADHQLVGTVPVANGGTGAATLTGYVKGNGTSAMTASATVPSTDITGLGTMSTQNANNVAVTGGSMSGVTISDYVATATKGVANGVASLDGSGTVPVSQLPAAVLGALSYQGTWNASTNTPTLTSSVGTKGYYYVVNVAGSTNLNGITDWVVGDWAVFNGSVWQKVDNTDAVTSVNGYTGTVVLTAADVSAVPYTGATGAVDLNNKSLTNVSNLGVGTSTVPTIKIRAVGDNNSSSRIAMRGYSSDANSSAIRVTKFRGTASAPQAPQSGDSLGKFELAGYGTTSSEGYPQASLEGLATEAWGATARGTKAVIKVTPNTTTTQVTALTIDQNSAATFASSVTATSFSGSGSGLTSIPNSALTNSAITINGTSTSLGGSISVGTVTSVTGTSPVVSSGGNTPAISMPAATTSVSGYLTSTDWNTFNNKGSGTVTSVSATSPVTSSGGATPTIAMPAATTSVSGYLTSTDWNTFNNKGSGTVTAVSVASANGFAGTSSGGATPALTLTTSISGVLKGNGAAISAATSGTDYSAGTSALSTGILKSTTTTGALTIAVAADFPTLNQNTTGTASNVTGTVAIANGGTGQTTRQDAMDALAGATTSGSYLRGNGTDVVMSTIQAADVPTLNQDTTGTAAKANALNSATTVVNVSSSSAPSAGQVLTATSGTAATWQTPTSGGVTSFSAGTTGFTPSTGTTGAVTLAGTLAVANGGTGQTSYTNGQLLIGNTTGNTLTKATLTAGLGIAITNAAGSITIANSLAPYSIEYLVVAGGGGGGRESYSSGLGGGGGAGGYRTATGFSVTTGTVYTVTVGAGGASISSGSVGNNGNNSVFSTITSTAGGGGGGGSNSGNVTANSGGSGGGACNGTNTTGAAGTSGQGSAGGNSFYTGTGTSAAGGGGGASAVGANAASSTGGAGGAGTASSITGSSVTYAGGGGGAAYSTAGAGGSGGGGAGAVNGSTAGADGTANTGGGGGGGANSSPLNSGAGGSGVVILSIPTTNYSGTTTGSPTVTTSGSNTILKYTSSGTYTG